MIDPRFLNVLEWTDRMAQLLDFPVYRLIDPDAWADWARYVQSFPSISVFNPPDPAQFADWREWAERFNQAVEL